jgi:hypothetical protein
MMSSRYIPLFLTLLLLAATGCSHNPAVMTIGRRFHIGTTEYGDMTYLNGFAIVDCSRENSEWEIEIDDTDGISFDPATKTLKGVKRIRRRIGKQVTGYLKDLGESNPEAVKEYLKGSVMFDATPLAPEKKEVGPQPQAQEPQPGLVDVVVRAVMEKMSEKQPAE